MFITTPARLLKLLAISPQLRKQELEGRRHRSDHFLRNRDLWPTQAQFEAAAEHLTSRTGLLWSVHDTMAVLALFPFERIGLAEHGVSPSRGIDDALANVAAKYILHCRWPQYRERKHMNRFLEELRAQGEKLGFPRLHQAPEVISPEERRARFTLISGGPA